MADNRNISQHPPEPGIPPEWATRQEVIATADAIVAERGLMPPLSAPSLRSLADDLIRLRNWPSGWCGFVMVCVNNALWGGTVAMIAPEKRLLLMPQCLRREAVCQGECDDYGLVCAECGGCAIGALEALAGRLGCAALVAEGTSAVEQLIASGRCEAVIGIGCLESLAKTLPGMIDRALPGLAIPLLYAGCAGTAVDLPWVEAIMTHPPGALPAPAPFSLRKFRQLRETVAGWFAADFPARIFPGSGDETHRLAGEWVCAEGKRWRPFLVAAVAQALNNLEIPPPAVRDLAIAIECFHKASLVHDDIEDGDSLRYGAPTLHRRHGVPAALNIGDLLIGIGYHLVADCELAAENRVRMLSTLADAQIRLCQGQGREFAIQERKTPPTTADTLALFALKTAPAFEAALVLGALAGGAPAATIAALKAFSRPLGLGYQIRDDLADFAGSAIPGQHTLCSSVLVAHLLENDRTGSLRRLYPFGREDERRQISEAVRSAGTLEWAKDRMERCKDEAQQAAEQVDAMRLRQLLFRVAGRIVDGNSTV